jgi:hypothetical protein
MPQQARCRHAIVAKVPDGGIARAAFFPTQGLRKIADKTFRRRCPGGEAIRQGRRRGRHGDRGDFTFGSQLLQKALRPRRLEPATAVSEQQDPRQQQDSNVTVAIAGVVAVIATAAILYISGMFN